MVPQNVADLSHLHLKLKLQLNPWPLSFSTSSLLQCVISVCYNDRATRLCQHVWLNTAIMPTDSLSSSAIPVFSGLIYVLVCFHHLFPNWLKTLARRSILMLASRDETMPGSEYSTQNSPPQLARTGMPDASACRHKRWMEHEKWTSSLPADMGPIVVHMSAAETQVPIRWSQWDQKLQLRTNLEVPQLRKPKHFPAEGFDAYQRQSLKCGTVTTQLHFPGIQRMCCWRWEWRKTATSKDFRIRKNVTLRRNGIWVALVVSAGEVD